MAYDQNSTYSAPRRQYYNQSQPQQYAQQGPSYEQQYRQPRQGQVDPYAQSNGYGQQQQQQQQQQEYGRTGYAQPDHYGHTNGYDRSGQRPVQQQNGYAQTQHQQGYQQQQPYDQRRPDPRYQQRNVVDHQQATASSYHDPRQQQMSPTRVPGQQSPQHLQPQHTVPKKLSMEEWKAQEKARMHKAADRPETLPQDNAFPTFPTKKGDGSRGQSAMSTRSGDDRPATATSSRPDERRPGVSREGSYKHDFAAEPPRGSIDQRRPSVVSSARPSMDSQHRPLQSPDRYGSPLNERNVPPAQMQPPPRKDSASGRSQTRPMAIDTSYQNFSQPQSPVNDQSSSYDSRHRRPSEQPPMSPLGKFSQSATEQQSLHSAIDNVFQDYSDLSKGAPTKPLTREEEIEAEMPDFGSSAPIHKRKQTVDQHLHGATTQTPPVPAIQNNHFDFGFGGQRSASAHPANEYASLVSAPFADDYTARGSMDSARTMPYRTAATTQPAAHNACDNQRNPSITQQSPAAPWAGNIQRSGSAPPDRDPRAGYGVQSLSKPDALPAHPTPVRPGLMNGNAQPARPAPVRNYDIGRSTPQTPQVQQVQQQQARPAPNDSVDSPLTQGELQQLRAQVDANPTSSKLNLLYAKKLVEASKTLVNEHGRADPKIAAKNRERYLMEAYKRVKKLASAGYPDAQFYLADCYGQGLLGLEIDPKEAFKYYQSAAKAGHATAAYRTAVCCELGAEDGGGTSKDYPRAVQWYKRAAALGETAAMFKIGMISLKGLLGQPRHLGEAFIWLKRAAERADKDNPHALYELAVLYDSSHSTPEIRQKVIPDDKYALQLYRQAAELGSKNAQHQMGKIFEYGLLGMPVDHRTSISFYSKAAAQQHHGAELALSGWYLTGAPGVLEANETEAFLWAKKAARSEPPLANAFFALAYFYEMGIGCTLNHEEARRWYNRAASYKHPRALQRLELMRKGQKGGYKAANMNGRLARKDQKMDETECVVM